VREDFAPLGEALVGAEQEELAGVVATGDDLEEQVGVAAVVREVADFVDAKQVRDGVTTQSSSQGGS
jgi:hypothetical protein